MSTIRKGFTLIEVAVVLVVLAILAAIAIPTFAAFMDGVDERALTQEASAILSDAKALDALDGVQGNDWVNDVTTAVSEIDAANVAMAVADNGGAAEFQLDGERGTLNVVLFPDYSMSVTYF